MADEQTGVCKYCDELTDRQERGWSTGYHWEWVCPDCDFKINSPESMP